jgi:hypothetical protein
VFVRSFVRSSIRPSLLTILRQLKNKAQWSPVPIKISSGHCFRHPFLLWLLPRSIDTLTAFVSAIWTYGTFTPLLITLLISEITSAVSILSPCNYLGFWFVWKNTYCHSIINITVSFLKFYFLKILLIVQFIFCNYINFTSCFWTY